MEQKKNKKEALKTSEGLAVFRKLLKEAGFQPKDPDLQTAWNVFKRFIKLSFDCADDSLLFETGVYDVTGEEMFYLSLVRQFTIEVDGEYDYMEQIHLDLLYKPDEILGNLEETIRTYEFDDEIPAFLEAVEQSPSFKILMEQYHPSAADIYQDEI